MNQGVDPELRTVKLGDGRQLAYVRSQDPGSQRVFFFHGTPGSRLFRPPDPMLPASLDIDLVTVDRPGYGHSRPQPHRTLLNWPTDVDALADHLGWSQFAMIGISGGGAFALACALRLPERITKVGLVSSVAPFWPDALRGMLGTTRRGFQLAHFAPWLLLLAGRWTAQNPKRFIARLRRELPDPDRRILARPDVAGVIANNAAEALAGGEFAREMVLLRRDWGFALADIAIPVVLWHGEADCNVPVAHGRRLASSLPDCHATFVPDAGHYFIFDWWGDILLSAAS